MKKLTTHPLLVAIRLQKQGIKSNAHPRVQERLNNEVTRLARSVMERFQATDHITGFYSAIAERTQEDGQ